ncbi:MAG: hypothetical protein FD180_3785 [Planctomycetota bacterium]|nr:MAG: hypothetical protein FD180_3785 [Planctomycetota bacterium]
MRLPEVVAVSLAVASVGVALVIASRTSVPNAAPIPPTPSALVESEPAGGQCQLGHGQKWERLPFRSGANDTVPDAKTPHGGPLAMADFLGTYSHSAGMGGSSLVFRANGTCTTSSGACLASGSSEGVFRIVDDRIEIECLSLAGRRNGNRCLCTPVWWKGCVYILGPSGDWMPGGFDEFCNAINWGEEPRDLYDRRNLEHLYMSEIRRDGTTSVPAAVAQHILRAPLRGRRIVGDDGLPRVDLGSVNGVWVGQRLLAGGHGVNWLRVLSVDKESCVVAPCFSWDSGPLPEVGAEVTCEARGADELRDR